MTFFYDSERETGECYLCTLGEHATLHDLKGAAVSPAKASTKKPTPLHDKGEIELRASTGGLFTVKCDCGAFTILVARDKRSLRAQLDKLADHKPGRFPRVG